MIDFLIEEPRWILTIIIFVGSLIYYSITKPWEKRDKNDEE